MAGRDLRMALGHRAIAQRKNQVSPPIPEDPVSPPGILVVDEEATAAAAAQGRRRSSLNADTTFLEQVHSPDSGAGAGAEEQEQEEEAGESTIAPLVCARASSTASQDSCSSLPLPAGLLMPGLGEQHAALPSFLEEKERQQAAVAFSESPSPSQRAALLDGDGGRGASSGLNREAEAEELEAEAEAAVRVMDHLIADRMIAERPELRRYDSADAELEEAARRQRRQKQQGQGQQGGGGSSLGHGHGHGHVHGRRASSPTEALAHRVESELHLGGDDDDGSSSGSSSGSGGGPLPASALHNPPRTHARRRSSALVELEAPAEEGEAATAGAQQEEGQQSEPLGPPRPLLAHFDSGDYFLNKEKDRQARGNSNGNGSSSIKGSPAAIKPEEQEGGHKAAAAFLLHRGHDRIGR